MKRTTAIAGFGLVVCAAATARAAPLTSVLSNYDTLGVGAYGEGILHADGGAARLDIGLGEASAAVVADRTVIVQAGYQFGADVFLGLAGGRWSVRAGVNPGTGQSGIGAGYGAPLLPMPAVVTSAVRDSYRGLHGATLDPTLIDVVGSGVGPVAAALAAGASVPLGVGAQAGFSAELGFYAFAGAQGRF